MGYTFYERLEFGQNREVGKKVMSCWAFKEETSCLVREDVSCQSSEKVMSHQVAIGGGKVTVGVEGKQMSGIAGGTDTQ